MIGEFEALLAGGGLTSEEQVEIEDAILELNQQLSVLRRNAAVPAIQVSYFIDFLIALSQTRIQTSSSRSAPAGPTIMVENLMGDNIITASTPSATMTPKAIE